MWLTFGFTILLMLISIGIDSQKIVLDDPQRFTPCAQGLRSGIDAYRITGTVGPKYYDFVASGWLPLVSVHILTNTSTQFSYMCPVLIGTNGSACISSSTRPCYCDYIHAITGAAHIVVTVTAQLSDSLATIRGQWQFSNGSVIYSDRNLTLPLIYDTHRATLDLTVNNNPTEQKPGSCDSTFPSADNNTVKLCCLHPDLPCYPRISLNGSFVAENDSPCVNHKFVSPSDSYTVNVIKSYSLCSKTDYIPAGSCMIQITRVSTTVSAPISDSTEVHDEEGCPVLKCVVPIVVVIGALVAGTFIGGICYKQTNNKKTCDVEQNKQSPESMEHCDKEVGKTTDNFMENKQLTGSAIDHGMEGTELI